MWTALPGEPGLMGAHAKRKRLTRDSAGGRRKKRGQGDERGEMKERSAGKAQSFQLF